MSNRPGGKKSSGAVRLLAPLALIVFALASFGVLSSTGSSDSNSATTEKSSTESGAAKSGAAGSDSSAGSVTVTTRKTYTVKAGDSFAAIAEKLNVDVDTLAELNSEVDPRALQPGQKLKLR